MALASRFNCNSVRPATLPGDASYLAEHCHRAIMGMPFLSVRQVPLSQRFHVATLVVMAMCYQVSPSVTHQCWKTTPINLLLHLVRIVIMAVLPRSSPAHSKDTWDTTRNEPSWKIQEGKEEKDIHYET